MMETIYKRLGILSEEPGTAGDIAFQALDCLAVRDEAVKKRDAEIAQLREALRKVRIMLWHNETSNRISEHVDNALNKTEDR